jgi:glycosyltransferase involved in cell wall biosynthesis
MKNSITYFHRNKNNGFSIQKVFTITINEIKKMYTVGELYVPYANASPVSLLKNLIYVFKHRNKAGINHITGDIHYCIIALIGYKSVLTIHDLAFIKNSKNRIDRFFKYLFWLYLPVKLATWVVCISENTKNEVLKLVNKKNIAVIPNPVDAAFQYSEKAFNAECPLVLHIGTGWNKNLNRVIEALAAIPCRLRIIGKLKNKDIKLLDDKKIEYSNAYSLTDKEIVVEYKNCDIVSFPSVYEGFGMPIIEGLATGRILLTSNIAPMTEVGGDSVVYVNPFDTESIRTGFLKAIRNKDLRDSLLKKSRVRIDKFAAKKIADSYLSLYKSIG